MKKVLSTIICLMCWGMADAQHTYTLAQLKDSALHNNIAIRSGKLSIDAAMEQRREAFTKYFPNVSGTGAWFNANKGMARMDVDPSGMISPELGAAIATSLPAEALAALSSPISISMMKNGAIGSLMAIQPIYAGGQIVNGNRLAVIGEDVARLQLSLSENDVERQTEQYFWQLVTLQEKLHTLDAADTLLADIAKDVTVAIRAGVALRNDLLQVQLRQNDLVSQRLKVNNGICIVRLLLAQYCGIRDTSFVVNTGSPSSSGIVPAASSEALPKLTEYKLLEKQVEAARIEERLALGQNLPTVAVGVGYNYHNMLGNDRTFGMLFATVSIPISDWWGGSHAIKRKKIAHQQAIDQLHDSSELLQIRMLNAWNCVVEAQSQLDLARRSIEQAKENLRLHRDFYRAGTATMSDLLEAQLLYQQTQDRHTDAYADLQNKMLEYRQSIGE